MRPPMASTWLCWKGNFRWVAMLDGGFSPKDMAASGVDGPEDGDDALVDQSAGLEVV